MKIYLIQGERPVEYPERGSNNFHVWIVEAHTKRNTANKRMRELQQAVFKWNRLKDNPAIRDGERADVLLWKMKKQHAEPSLNEENIYDVVSVELKGDRK